MSGGNADMQCKICGSEQTAYSRAQIISKYDIQYFTCPSCGFIQTEEPYWLDEVYGSAIASSDVGAVSRMLSLGKTVSQYISLLFDARASFLDYGGGHGLFARHMRDKGYDFYWYDKYAKNLYANGFEAQQGQTFGLVTAFEVFEHLADPLPEIEKMLRYSRSLLFSTLLVPASGPKPLEWSYFALETGQHISFYTLESLRIVAKKSGLFLHSVGGYLHLLTEEKISPLRFRLLTGKMLGGLLRGVYSRKSLHDPDFTKITGGLYGP
jgi:2-polyprenyl-3-methyl-5-hydroxy-6-metoxy-1,4-benzoquinol methylase